MNSDIKVQNLNIEKAIRLLVKYVPYDEDRKKLIIPHCIRVGFFLLEKGYSMEIILGGLLHDIIEWTNSPEELIKNEFGDHIFGIVKANTQNSEIRDRTEKWQDMVNRCVEYGEDALIVKSADAIDSYKYYKEIDDVEEINRSVKIGKYILDTLPKDFKNPIFEELKSITK